MWCERCGYNVTKEYIEENDCPYWECPMENRTIDTRDQLHQVLGEALKRGGPTVADPTN